MTKSVKKIALTVAALILCVSAAFAGVFLTEGKAESTGDVFRYSESTPLKYKAGVSALGSTKKGLLLYGYEQGASAEFKGSFGGVFETELKPVSEDGGADLRNYSLVFTDEATGRSVAVEIKNGNDSSFANVNAEGNKAGVVYFNNEWYKDRTCGYTAAYNLQGTYTEFSPVGSTFISFNPETKRVSVRGENENYRTVWDFGKEINDGKSLKFDFPSFERYSVKVVFDEIKTSGKGELLVYNFGGFALDKKRTDSALTMSVSVKTKAIVGETYDLPEAYVEDLFRGKVENPSVAVRVYNENGEIVNGGKTSFTPEKKGNYYAYYAYAGNGASVSQYCLIEAIEENEVMSVFDYETEFSVPETAGLHARAYLPEATLDSSLSCSGLPVKAIVTVYKNGKAEADYEKINGGVYYSFDALGEYEIVYSTELFGDKITDSRKLTVTAEKEGIVLSDLEATLEYGSTLSFVPAKIYVRGEELTATANLLYPSGKTAAASGAVLDELGKYTLTEEWKGGENVRSFMVANTYKNVFSDSSAVEFGALDFNNEVYGHTITLKNNLTLVYNKIIDLSDNVFDTTLSDKSQNVPFVELVTQPNKLGQKDMTALYVELVDAHDSTNFVTIRMKYFDYAPNIMRIRTKASGQGYVGYYYDYKGADCEVNDAPSHDDGGFISPASFTQNLTGRRFDETILKLYFDYNECALYATPDHFTGDAEHGSPEVPWLVRDFDTTDPYLSAGQTPWKGFTNGEVYMRIYAAGITSTAKVGVLSVDGDPLTETFVDDTEAPSISVDLPNEEVPFAIVNKPYRVFDFTAADTYTGVKTSEPVVYFGESKIDVKNGEFVPTTEGVYTIVYTACDYYGNVSEKRVNVTAKRSVSKPEAAISRELDKTAAYGKKIILPEITAQGGVGGLTTYYEVFCNGEAVTVEYGEFRCLREGTYTVRFIVTDYVGQQTVLTRYFTVSRGNAPVFDEDGVALPPIFFAGESYMLGDYSAYLYGTGSKEEVKSRTEVYDYATGEWREISSGTAYRPVFADAGKTAKIRFTFAGGSGEDFVYETEVPIKDSGIGYQGFMDNLFINGGDADAKTRSDGLYFNVPAGKNGSTAFARKISVKHLSFGFKIGGERFAQGFDVMKITLRDSENPTVKVTVTIENHSPVYRAKVNGVSRAFSVEPAGAFSVKFNAETNEFTDVYGYVFGKAEHTDEGREFGGFPSGYVYAEFELIGATENPVSLLNIANQNLNDTSGDYNQPLITLSDYVSGKYEIGDTVTLPAASAYDVLSEVEDVRITVKCGEEVVLRGVSAATSQTFKVEKYGAYSIIYSTKDAEGNVASVTRYVYCSDSVKPELIFDGSLPQSVKSGTTIKLPSYTIKDNGDVSKAKVFVYMCTPDGVMYTLKGEGVKLTGHGEYEIYYYVQDENDNSQYYRFKIVVNE